MKNILVNVVVPAYNTEKYIKEMINCLINQLYKNLQILIVDDGATDDTAKIIKNFKDDRIEYY